MEAFEYPMFNENDAYAWLTSQERPCSFKYLVKKNSAYTEGVHGKNELIVYPKK